MSDLLRDIERTDLAVYETIAQTPTPTLDAGLRRLTGAADRSRLWFALAVPMALVPGRSRVAALTGVASIGMASAAVNLVAKGLLPRPRPTRLDHEFAGQRHVAMPTSTSFPSGHSASAFAFASGVGHELPGLSLPLHLLAATVAYSRVHTGVHYPADAVVGAAVGSAAAALTAWLLTGARKRLHPVGGEHHAAPVTGARSRGRRCHLPG